MPQAIDQRLTIGAVLALLQGEFPDMDVTISKIRFLETEGLVEPGRTPTGYRKFSTADVDRLRYTLTMQRDHFLPLRVIREHLDKIDQGWEPPVVPENAPRVPLDESSAHVIPAPELTDSGVSVTMSVTDLAEQAGITVSEAVNLRKMKLIAPISGTEDYRMDALEIARGIADLAQYGIQARHVAQVRNAADRQVELITNVLGPKVGVVGAEISDEVRQQAQDIATHLLRLQSMLIRSALASTLGGDPA